MSNPNRPRWKTLTEQLSELQATDPAVARAADRFDESLWRMLFWKRANERRASEGKAPIGPFAPKQRR